MPHSTLFGASQSQKRVFLFAGVLGLLSLCNATSNAATITLGNTIKGVTTSGTGESGSAYEYDFGGGNLDWVDDDAEHNGTSYTRFFNVANVYGLGASASSGTVNKGGSPFSGTKGDLRFELNTGAGNGEFHIKGYLSTRNTSLTGSSNAGDIHVFAQDSITIEGWHTVTLAPNASGRQIGEWSLSTHAPHTPGSVSLFSDGDITLAKGINMSRGGDAVSTLPPTGFLTIRGTVDENARAGAVHIGGDIMRRRQSTTSGQPSSSANGNTAGDITILSNSSVTIAGNIETRSTTGTTAPAGNLLIDAQGNVKIQGNTGVILTQNRGNAATAGSVSLRTSSGDIEVAGSFNLGFEINPPSNREQFGALTLETESGKITLGSLNLADVRYASFDAGQSFILGDLLGFNTANSGGAGSLASPLIATQTFLRAAPTQIIYYDPEVAGNNYLNGLTYQLANLQGDFGVGGMLTPVPEPSTYALTMLGLAGLALWFRVSQRQHARSS